MLVETSPDSSQILLSHISSNSPNHVASQGTAIPRAISDDCPTQPGSAGLARFSPAQPGSAPLSAGNDLSDIGSDPQELTRAGSHDDGS